MGCGSSSLKGDAPDGLAQPVSTSSGGAAKDPGTKGTFASVDYDTPAERKKSRWNAAPHETEMPADARGGSVDGVGPGGVLSSTEPTAPSDINGTGAESNEMRNLQPYHTTDEEHMAASSPTAVTYPHERPTSSSQAQTNGIGDGGQDLKFISDPEELERERREAETAGGKKGSLLGRIKGGRNSQEVGDGVSGFGGVGAGDGVR